MNFRENDLRNEEKKTKPLYNEHLNSVHSHTICVKHYRTWWVWESLIRMSSIIDQTRHFQNDFVWSKSGIHVNSRIGFFPLKNSIWCCVVSAWNFVNSLHTLWACWSILYKYVEIWEHIHFSFFFIFELGTVHSSYNQPTNQTDTLILFMRSSDNLII